jgi:hypothetical protein
MALPIAANDLDKSASRLWATDALQVELAAAKRLGHSGQQRIYAFKVLSLERSAAEDPRWFSIEAGGANIECREMAIRIVTSLQNLGPLLPGTT